MRDFHEALGRSPDMAVAVAAIKALTNVVTHSQAQTMMGLEKDLKDAAASLMRCAPQQTAVTCRLLISAAVARISGTAWAQGCVPESLCLRQVSGDGNFVASRLRAVPALHHPHLQPRSRRLCHCKKPHH